MTPLRFNSNNYAVNLRISSNGGVGTGGVDASRGIRPVINLDKNVTISSGDGTISNPYVVGA